MRCLTCVPVLLVAWLIATPGLGQGCASGPPTQLGMVSVLSTSCVGIGGPPGTPCFTLRVQCQGIPPIDVRLRISEPPSSVSLRGTVVFGVGGGGIGFYRDRPGGAQLFSELLAHGFRIVDRSWNSSWFGDPVGMRKQSCRYATLLTWVHANVHTTGVFCASGNSGGSGEICYALAAWGRGAILDVAVPTSGPPMARLDLQCQDPITPAWQGQCGAIIPDNVLTCGSVSCSVSAPHASCVSCSTNPTPQQLLADSILHPGAALHYPNTRVHQVLGTNDCTSAVPLGLLFHQAVTSEKAISWAAGAPHWAATTATGRRAIVRALLGGAACAGGPPATVAWQQMPVLGGTLDIDLHGPPGGAYLLGGNVGLRALELPGFGWLFVDDPITIIGSGTLDSVSGRATFVIPVADPSLVGLEAWIQALAGSCLTNVVRIVVS